MKSRQQKKKKGASDLSDVNRDKERVSYQEWSEPGVQSSHNEHATCNADVGYFSSGNVADRDRSREKSMTAKEMMKERTQELSENSKDAANETNLKTLEAFRSAADKTKETTQSAVGKLGELKDKAMGLFSGTKEEAKDRMYEAAGTTEEKPRVVEEEIGLTDRDKGKEHRGGRILGALDTLKEKLVPHTSDADKERNEGEKKTPGTSKEKVVKVYMENTSSGANGSDLKASDQMTGQGFDNIGRIKDERVVRIVRRDLQGKL